ncbi:hypothetical protein [Luteococcus sanguinis]|uniref:Uncharacterized protein n=1 Tax=Luteococcus sanguinis TaxID=174038 RepID=A0ABW1X0M6_9ACTN
MLTGNSAYVNDSIYSVSDNFTRITSGPVVGKFTWQSRDYGQATDRLTRLRLDRENIAKCRFDA